MGFNFAGKAIHIAIWVAAGSLFMELIGFSTQKWVTAGGLGTVILTLSGREVQQKNLFVMVYSIVSFPVKFVYILTEHLIIVNSMCRS